MQSSPTDAPNIIAKAVAAAGDMYPTAEIKVRRGKVFAIDGDVIRMVRYRVESTD